MTILTDTEIKKRMTDKELILNGNKSLVGSACYELRMGNIYYDLTEDDRRFDANSNGTILVKPGHRVVLITKEQLKIPNNIVARITSKGSLFSIGLSPVSTYADPGFSGNLGIVTQNFSDKYIDLPIGEPIAKVDFSLLSTATETRFPNQNLASQKTIAKDI
jgi:dCTP deaminase